MTNEQLLAEIREANLTYLMLAQNLIRHDKAEAVFRLGMNEDAADILASLSAAQVLKLASRNTLLCSFRVDDNPDQPLGQEGGQRSHQHAARQHPDGQPRVGSALILHCPLASRFKPLATESPPCPPRPPPPKPPPRAF